MLVHSMVVAAFALTSCFHAPITTSPKMCPSTISMQDKDFCDASAMAEWTEGKAFNPSRPLGLNPFSTFRHMNKASVTEASTEGSNAGAATFDPGAPLGLKVFRGMQHTAHNEETFNRYAQGHKSGTPRDASPAEQTHAEPKGRVATAHLVGAKAVDTTGDSGAAAFDPGAPLGLEVFSGMRHATHNEETFNQYVQGRKSGASPTEQSHTELKGRVATTRAVRAKAVDTTGDSGAAAFDPGAPLGLEVFRGMRHATHNEETFNQYAQGRKSRVSGDASPVMQHHEEMASEASALDELHAKYAAAFKAHEEAAAAAAAAAAELKRALGR